jgi:hypothetical protein
MCVRCNLKNYSTDFAENFTVCSLKHQHYVGSGLNEIQYVALLFWQCVAYYLI